MKNLLLLNISYDGHAYFGFQIQKNQPTIHGAIDAIIKKNFSFTRLRIYCSSRTDAKVHALDQYVLINSCIDYEKENFEKIIKDNLPSDIKLISCRRAPKNFNIIGGCLHKEYKYLFSNMHKDIESHYFNNFKESLSFDLMQQACKMIEGVHEFKHFQYRGSQKITRREVLECSISKSNELFFKDDYPDQLYTLTVKGKGFMRHMVRIIMGAVINVGSKQKSLEDLSESLKGRGYYTGFIAPAKGLYQYKTTFQDLNTVKKII
jgi:tRNA pseudouridine38-40 synthase